MGDSRPPLPSFLRLRLTTQAVAIGERVKKGTFRPCVETLPTSTLMGCFKEYFGLDAVAIGFFDLKTYRKETFTYSPFNSAVGTAKLPLTLEYLAPKDGYREITGEIYVAASPQTRATFAASDREHTVALGALRSKGFGECALSFESEVQPQHKAGYLRGNLRETDAAAFGINLSHDLIRPRYGYLFRPDAYRIGGQYERALFMGTILDGPDFLLEREYVYDR